MLTDTGGMAPFWAVAVKRWLTSDPVCDAIAVVDVERRLVFDPVCPVTVAEFVGTTIGRVADAVITVVKIDTSVSTVVVELPVRVMSAVVVSRDSEIQATSPCFWRSSVVSNSPPEMEARLHVGD
jgi:hypothetical protein